jgi:hypothetical protein
MAPSDIEPSELFFDLSQYTSAELVDFWKSDTMIMMTDPGLLVASLDDEITFCKILEIMVTDSSDIFSRDNVNWVVTDAIEAILLDILPLANKPQSGGAMLLLSWIHWVNGRLIPAFESFVPIKETNFDSPLVDYMLFQMFPEVVPIAERIRAENG